jgi:tetratricopeptide (TPR) repeat protein
VALQEEHISGNTGLQIVGAHSRLGYVHYLRGDYDEALREYARELAFIGTSDHALRDRTLIELNVKLGAAYHRLERAEEAQVYFERALKSFAALVSKGADDPFTRYYIATLHALRGEHARAIDSLGRVAAKLPALTAARASRDPDLASLRDLPAFQSILTGSP